MRGDPVSQTFADHSVKQVRDKKLEMLADWEEANNMPGKVIVRRGYDFQQNAVVTTITVRSTIPRHMRWNG